MQLKMASVYLVIPHVKNVVLAMIQILVCHVITEILTHSFSKGMIFPVKLIALDHV